MLMSRSWATRKAAPEAMAMRGVARITESAHGEHEADIDHPARACVPKRRFDRSVIRNEKG